MQKRLYLGLVIALVLFLCACGNVNMAEVSTPVPTVEAPTTEPAAEKESAASSVQPVSPAPTYKAPSAAPTAIAAATPAPAHSALYLPEYTPQQILEYFEEVVLHMEYSDGIGNTALVQKWNIPIRYRIYGEPTEEDLLVLEDLFDKLNEVHGFPGIHAAGDGEPENLMISFQDKEAFDASFADLLGGEEADGATQFWYYTDTNEIYTAEIGYRTDIDQTARTSILIEEVVNMLGISDTVLRTDSIVYQYSNDNTSLSDVDWVILKLLYDPAIQCGTDFDSCSSIIQQLYY